MKRRHCRRIGKRLVEIAEEAVHGLCRVAADLILAMFGSEHLRNLPGVGGFVMTLVTEADGTCLDAPCRRARHHGNDCARIYAAAEKGAKGHIGHHPAGGALLDEPVQLFGRRLFAGAGSAPGKIQVPVLHQLRGPPCRDLQIMGGRQLEDAPENGFRRGDIEILEIVCDGCRLYIPGDATQLEERLEFRGKGDSVAAAVVVVERFFADPVPGEEQLCFCPVPEGKGKHAVQPGQAGSPVPCIEGKDDLRIAPAPEAVPLPFEFVAQILKVVDLPVEDDDVAAIHRGHRLIAERGEIDDAETPVCQSDQVVQVLSGCIRPAVGNDLTHALQGVFAS